MSRKSKLPLFWGRLWKIEILSGRRLKTFSNFPTLQHSAFFILFVLHEDFFCFEGCVVDLPINFPSVVWAGQESFIIQTHTYSSEKNYRFKKMLHDCSGIARVHHLPRHQVGIQDFCKRDSTNSTTTVIRIAPAQLNTVPRPVLTSAWIGYAHRNNRHRMRAPISCQSKYCRHKMADL